MGALHFAWRQANSMAVFFNSCSNFARASGGTGRRVVIIIDNAPYHHSRLHQPWREKQAHRFALDFLPPYSPELNPIERVWKLTRRRCLHNRYFENLKDIVSAAETEFANWTTRNEALRRLCAIT
jgi:transposase